MAQSFRSSFFKGPSTITGPGNPGNRFVNAVDGSSAAIKRFLTEATHGPAAAGREARRTGTYAPAVGIELHAGEVLQGLVTLGLSMNRPAILALMGQGRDWVWDIRDHTPNGPPRPALASKMKGRSDYAVRMPDLPANSQGYHLWRREAMMCWTAIDRARQRQKVSGGLMRRGVSGSTGDIGRFIDDDRAIVRTRQMLMEGEGGANIRGITWGGEDKGSLWASIGVQANTKSGVGELSAFSNNFYAGYVNDGFEHGLVPIIRTTRRDGKLSNPRNKVWAVLSIEWLGNYPIWGHESYPTEQGTLTGQIEAFAFHGETVGQAGSGDTIGMGSVAFAKRDDPAASVKIQARKHQEGKHFFEKGTEKFLMRVLPRWRTDVDNIIRQAFYEGKTFHSIDALYKRRVSKGASGGNRPGTFA